MTEALAAAIAATRRRSAQESDQSREEMKLRMKAVMTEIDVACGRFISGAPAPFQFLDVCCCPGGFSEYTLDGNLGGKGVGLSLNVELGGHKPAIRPFPDRYHLHFVDVTTVASRVRLLPLHNQPEAVQQRLRLDMEAQHIAPRACDLVILDGSFLGGKDWIIKHTTLTDAENPAFNVYCNQSAAHQALLVAQLIVFANNLRPGGTLVLRLNMFPDLFVSGVLCLFRRVFTGEILSYKPRTCHAHVGSYYVVCKGFNPDIAEQMQWVPRFKASLERMRAGGHSDRVVPFPELQESQQFHLTQDGFWGDALQAFHIPLWRFHQLIVAAMGEKKLLDHVQPGRPRRGRFTGMCQRLLIGGTCHNPNCTNAHIHDELHGYVQKAYRERVGKMHYPLHVPHDEAEYRDPIEEFRREQQGFAAAGLALPMMDLSNYWAMTMEGLGGEWLHAMADRPEMPAGDAMLGFMAGVPGMPQAPRMQQALPALVPVQAVPGFDPFLGMAMTPAEQAAVLQRQQQAAMQQQEALRHVQLAAQQQQHAAAAAQQQAMAVAAVAAQQQAAMLAAAAQQQFVFHQQLHHLPPPRPLAQEAPLPPLLPEPQQQPPALPPPLPEGAPPPAAPAADDQPPSSPPPLPIAPPLPQDLPPPVPRDEPQEQPAGGVQRGAGSAPAAKRTMSDAVDSLAPLPKRAATAASAEGQVQAEPSQGVNQPQVQGVDAQAEPAEPDVLLENGVPKMANYQHRAMVRVVIPNKQILDRVLAYCGA